LALYTCLVLCNGCTKDYAGLSLVDSSCDTSQSPAPHTWTGSRCAVVSTHRLEEASDQVRARLRNSVLRIVRVNIDGRQFINFTLWIDEVVSV
jgi:hypothetical protein